MTKIQNIKRYEEVLLDLNPSKQKMMEVGNMTIKVARSFGKIFKINKVQGKSNSLSKCGMNLMTTSHSMNKALVLETTQRVMT